MCLGREEAPGVDTGVKTVSWKITPGRLSALRRSQISLPSIQGAPKSWKGVGVPRPSEIVVPSIRQMPGYTVAEARSGMLGEGLMKRNPVWSYH